MASITKRMSESEISALYNRIAGQALRETRPQHTWWQLKLSDVTITAYRSGKVLYQGNDLSWLEDDAPAASKSSESSASLFPQAGSDEVGTGDYIGPVVVAAAIVPDQKTADVLHELRVTDSKAMNDAAIRKIGPKLEALLPHSILILDNDRYNRIYDPQSMNINRIKAWLHNQAYLNLQAKGYRLPELAVVDQFCLPARYYSHLAGRPQIVDTLTFETKAESKYPAVAAASVLARWTFLRVWDALEKQAGMNLTKGGGSAATDSARRLAAALGKKQLSRFVKLHFANTSRL